MAQFKQVPTAGQTLTSTRETPTGFDTMEGPLVMMLAAVAAIVLLSKLIDSLIR